MVSLAVAPFIFSVQSNILDNFLPVFLLLRNGAFGTSHLKFGAEKGEFGARVRLLHIGQPEEQVSL